MANYLRDSLHTPDLMSQTPSDPVRALYRIGDATLIRTATHERLPGTRRYLASRLKRVARYYAGIIERQQNDCAGAAWPGIMLEEATRSMLPFIARRTQPGAQGGASAQDADSLAAIRFLCICSLEGLLDEPIYPVPEAPELLMIHYLTSAVTLADLSQKVGYSPGRVSSVISAAIADLWNRLPTSQTDDFPFDRAVDFPLWKLRQFRVLKRRANMSLEEGEPASFADLEANFDS